MRFLSIYRYVDGALRHPRIVQWNPSTILGSSQVSVFELDCVLIRNLPAHGWKALSAKILWVYYTLVSAGGHYTHEAADQEEQRSDSTHAVGECRYSRGFT